VALALFYCVSGLAPQIAHFELGRSSHFTVGDNEYKLIGCAYNFRMILLDFLRLLADTPKDKHPALIDWFTTQKKASANAVGLDTQALCDVVSKESHR
jgi:hypothetical protein